MSINKNFVVKNGFEVSTDLILANADTNKVGIGTTNPQYKLDVAGGIGATDFYLTGIGTFVNELNVGLGGTVLTVLGIGNSIGIGTALPQYLLDIRSPVSTGQTALYVQGDVRITGDLSLDDVTLDDATIQDLTVTNTLFTAGVSTFNSNVFINAALNVSGVTTLGSYVDINNSVDISNNLNVVGLSTVGGYVDINNSVDVAVDLNVIGLSTLGGYVDINDSVDISNNLNVVGVTTLATADINAGEIDVTRIGTNNLNVTGIATIASVSIVGAALSSLVVSGISTLSIVDINGGDIEVSNVDTVDLNVTGISTLGTVRISSGIITATSGIVTYYGDGQYLDLTNNPSTGIGIGTTGGLVGYGITFLDLKGAGVSTTFYNSNTGIATIFFEGGGGGSGTIGIGTEFPLSSVNGDLFFSAVFGRLFVYYDENIIGIGTDEFWIDAAPFNVGIITSLTNVSFVPGSASNPSMFFVGDSQTGFFSPTLGQVTVVSSGSSILNINPSGINVTGIVTASSFVGDGSGLTGISSVSFATTAFNLIGTASTASFATTSFGLSGSPNITVGIITGTTLNGTSGLVSVGTTIKVKGFVETQSTVSIADTILTLDASQGTVFTHTTSAQIGIVSFTGIRTDSAGAQTFSVLVTQGATPRNTTGATGIGTQLASILISPGNVGYSTHIKVGGGTSITLTNSVGAFDLLTFIVSYDGNPSIGNTSFTVVGFAATDFRNVVV